MTVIERWWRVRGQNGRTTWLDVDPEAEGMMQGAWHRGEVAGPFVLEADAARGAVDALRDLAAEVEFAFPASVDRRGLRQALDRAHAITGGQ
jgi:hypothetical protein